jgi:hypothetical protein
MVRAALLGTQRQPEPADAATGEPPLDAALAALAEQPAAARLLGTAALLDAWRRAGQRAGRTAASPPAPAPQAEARICSPLAGRVLRQLLGSGPPAVVAEWMVLAAAAGAAIPPEILPEVLDYARRHVHVRDRILPMLGARGRWLAALKLAWAFAADVAGDPAAAWQTGTAEERVHLLRRLRASDPAVALGLLRTTWATEPPRDRQPLVEALEVGLGMDDEPFLEAVLDDKRKEVRAAAARLLATLPESRLVRRMVDRLLPLFTLREGRGGRPVIEVELAVQYDKRARRDGIDDRPHPGLGPGASLLQQMLAAVPPSVWTAHWGMDAAAILDAVRAGAEPEDWATLVSGWTLAALHHSDVQWAEALLRPEAAGVDGIGRLAHLLPQDQLEALALERLPARHLAANEPAALLLASVGRTWSPALTRAALRAVPALAPLPDRDQSILRSRLSRYSLFMHPAAAVATLRELGDPHEGAWVDLLHLRHTLHQAFQ